MRLKVMIGIGAVFIASAANAMTAETFYVKASALQRQGISAMFSSDFSVLKSEMEKAVKSVKAENAAAKAKGRPLYCAPEKVAIKSDEVITEFGKIPKERRKKLTVRGAWREIAIRKYPC
jgi:hypothetical protein